MKYCLPVVLLLFIFSCQNNAFDEQESEAEIDSSQKIELNWLLGTWQRLNDESGKTTFEYWTVNENQGYSGLGYTMQAADTIWKEYMKLVEVDEQWQLEIRSPEEEAATVFQLTDLQTNSFTAENLDIEFPNRIEYKHQNDTIYATVSGGDMNIPFEFMRVDD
ncbi:MAG: hypothetical protein AAGI23_19165 [Bacteroidota bacterium]